MLPAIHLPAPCPARWDDLTPAPGGRHCAACNHIVVDFTTLSEADTLAALRQPGRVCGRFRPEQLAASDTPAGGWARWLAAVAVTLSACETSPPATVAPSTSAVPTALSATLRVQGQVLDAASGQPLDGAIVISEQDTTRHTRTSTDGQFSLELPIALRGTRLIAALSLPTGPHPDDTEFGLYIPRYFPAEPGAAAVVRLRNPGPMLGMPTLEPQEGYPPTIMPRLMRLAPPPPPLKLTY